MGIGEAGTIGATPAVDAVDGEERALHRVRSAVEQLLRGQVQLVVEVVEIRRAAGEEEWILHSHDARAHDAHHPSR